jgi:hypothetical protein
MHLTINTKIFWRQKNTPLHAREEISLMELEIRWSSLVVVALLKELLSKLMAVIIVSLKKQLKQQARLLDLFCDGMTKTNWVCNGGDQGAGRIDVGIGCYHQPTDKPCD